MILISLISFQKKCLLSKFRNFKNTPSLLITTYEPYLYTIIKNGIESAIKINADKNLEIVRSEIPIIIRKTAYTEPRIKRFAFTRYLLSLLAIFPILLYIAPEYV